MAHFGRRADHYSFVAWRHVHEHLRKIHPALWSKAINEILTAAFKGSAYRKWVSLSEAIYRKELQDNGHIGQLPSLEERLKRVEQQEARKAVRQADPPPANMREMVERAAAEARQRYEEAQRMLEAIDDDVNRE